jgi:hypothetical protein
MPSQPCTQQMWILWWASYKLKTGNTWSQIQELKKLDRNGKPRVLEILHEGPLYNQPATISPGTISPTNTIKITTSAFRFSRRRIWRWLSSGMLRRIVW